jgi:hypothetical protein
MTWPATGFFHTAACTVCPCQLTSCGSPALTDSKTPARPVVTGPVMTSPVTPLVTSPGRG